MKIVQINAVYRRFSTGRTTYEMSEYLDSLGIENYVIYGQLGEKTKPNVIYVGNEIQSKVSAAMGKLTGNVFCYARKNTRKICDILDRINPDTIILRNLHSNFVSIPMLLEFLSGKDWNVVFVLHDCFWYTGGCVHYSKNSCYKWKEGCKSCDYIKNFYSAFADKSEKLYAEKEELIGKIKNGYVIGVSDWITNESKKSRIFRNIKRFGTVYNFVDTEIFKPKNTDELRAKYSIDKNTFVVVAVATNWDNSKGLDIINKFAEQLKEDEIILLIGACNEKAESNRIVYTDTVSDTNCLSEYYSLSDCLLQCSVEESFGKVVAEALSCGTPVITNNKTANPELVPENCGVVLEKVDVDSLITAKDEIKANTKAYYSENARSFAIDNFSMNTNLNKYIDFIKLTEKE